MLGKCILSDFKFMGDGAADPLHVAVHLSWHIVETETLLDVWVGKVKNPKYHDE